MKHFLSLTKVSSSIYYYNGIYPTGFNENSPCNLDKNLGMVGLVILAFKSLSKIHAAHIHC
jgi:hypothetical protein